MTLRIFRVIVPVTDIDTAADFYARLLDRPGQRVSPGRHYFDCDGVILACFDPQADGDAFEHSANPDHIYLAVDDLEAVFARAQAMSRQAMLVEAAIETRPWGERSFYLQDPFGNKLCFVDETTCFTGA